MSLKAGGFRHLANALGCVLQRKGLSDSELLIHMRTRPLQITYTIRIRTI